MGKIKENRFCKQLLYIALTVAIMIIMLPGKSLAANNESSYTVEFTYNGKQYVMNGDTTVELSSILDCIGIAGTPTSVSVSDESLFSATQINEKWMVTAHQAFHTDEWMKVTIDGAEYEIVVTDDETYNISFNISSIKIGGTEVDAGSKITIGGKDYTFVTMTINFYSLNANGVQTSINKMSSSFQTFKGAWSNMSLTFRPKTYRISFMLKPLSDSDYDYLLPKSSSYVIKNGSKTVEGFNVSSTSVNVDITTPFVDPTYTAPSSPSASSGSILTYNGSAQQLVGAGSVSKPEGGTMQYALGNNATSKPTSGWSTTVPTGTNSGYYYVWWRIEESGIYNEVTGCCTSYINQASINPTVTMSGWTYGDAANEPSVSDNIGNGEVTYTYKRITPYSGGFTSTKPSTAGTYTVKATISSSPNYTGGTATANFTIAPKEVTLSWSNTALTYNGQSQKPTVTVGNLESGDTCTVTVTGERTNVGSYTATASGLSNSNYKLPTTNTRSCSITKAPLTVSADAKTITYGDAPNNNGVRYIGFMGSDSRYSLTGTLSYYYNYSQYGNVGSYTISPRGLTSDNYDITFTTGILTVSQKEVGLAWSDTSLTYNGSPQKPTAIATGTVNSDAIEVTVTGAQTDAGNDYTATAAALTGEKASNYKLPAANTSNFTINKKAVAVSGITADNKVYDRTTTAALNTSGASFAGILSGDSLTVSATGTFNNMNVGTGKTVNISNLTLGGASAGNYELADSDNQTTATANITAKPLTVTAEAKSKIYGSADPLLTYISSGLNSGDSFTGELSRDAGENVGTYAIGQGTLSAGDNYTISYTGEDFTIHKKTLSITADANTKTYGSADPAFTYNAEGFAYNDTVENVMNGALIREEGEDVRDGGYAILQGSLSAGNNYNISFTGEDLTITKRNVTLTSATDSKAYDGTALTNDNITVGGDGFAEGESAAYTFTASQTLPGVSDNTFTYELVDANPGNYDITTAYGKLTVNERSGEGDDGKYKITVKANSGTFTYDGKEHTVTGFETSEYSFNDVTYTVSGISASASLTDAGEAAVEIIGTPKVTDEDGNDLTGNFDIVCEAGSLTVNKCPQEKPDSLSSRKASSDTAKDGVISGLDEKKLYEYSEDEGVTWTKVDDGLAEITGIGAGDVLVRYQEEENSLPGIAVKVTIGIKDEQTKPSKDDIVITNTSEENVSDGEISGIDDTMEYSLDDGRNWTAVEENQTVIDNLPVGEVKIRFKGDDDKNPSESIKISIGVTSRTQGVVNFRSDESPVPVETSVESAQSSNIDEYAETQVEEGRDVKIELVITPRNEEDIAEASVTEIAKVSSEVLSSIEAENIETEYLEIDLAKYVDNNKEGNISDTGTPLEIELDYDSAKIGTPVVIRTHDGRAKVFERLSERVNKAFKDATYYVGDNKIYLYSQFFSDFAIVYATKKTYYVTIDTGIGDPVIQVVGENADIELPIGLTKEGCVFDGWYRDDKYEKAWYSERDKVNEDTKIYAKWNKYVTGVSVTADTVKLTKAGETSQIKVNIAPVDAANKNVTYKSSNTKAATVDSNGKITAVANGTATITITTEDGAKTAAVNVTVAIPEIQKQGTGEPAKTTDQSATTDNPVTAEPKTADQSAATEKNVTIKTKTTEQETITYKVKESVKEAAELSLNEGLKIDQTGSRIKVSWGKVSGADGYKVYVTYCGKKFSEEPAKTLKKASVTTATITKINGKKLNLKKNFKIYVVAYKKINGVNVTLGKSITGHIVGRKNKRYTNVRKIKITNHTIINVYIGTPHRIQAKTLLVEEGKKQLSDAHAKEFRYASSNKKIATVDKNGVIKGVKTGKCTIYVYARNGYAKKISVTVK